MLRNDLIIKLSEQDNDCVTVEVNGILIDVDSVARDRGNVVLVLDPEELRATLQQVASGKIVRQRPGSDVEFRREARPA